jgi:DNA-binding transcriptional MerR regulator
VSAAQPAQLRIGELAGQLGFNPKTIRYYEEIGLLPEPRRTPTGYRAYGPADLERLRFIAKAKAIGLTLDEIGEILALRREGERPCQHVLELVDRKLEGVEQQIRALQDFRQELLSLRAEAAREVAADGEICNIIEHHELGHPERNSVPALAPAGRHGLSDP